MVVSLKILSTSPKLLLKEGIFTYYTNSSVPVTENLRDKYHMVSSSWKHKALYQIRPEIILKQRTRHLCSSFSIARELYRTRQLANAMPFENRAKKINIKRPFIPLGTML